MHPLAVSNKRGGWWTRCGLGSSNHYFPANEDSSTCGLMSFWGRWKWKRVRKGKHPVCLLCQARYERWHSTTVNNQRVRAK